MPTFTFTDEEVALLRAAFCDARESNPQRFIPHSEVILAKLDNPDPEPVDATPEPEWHNLVSSNLKRCRYWPQFARLDVEFLSGVIWVYSDVPADLAARLAIADSPGRLFAAEVKGRFKAEKATEPTRQSSGPTPLEQFQASVDNDARTVGNDSGVSLLPDPEDAERSTNPREEEERG